MKTRHGTLHLTPLLAAVAFYLLFSPTPAVTADSPDLSTWTYTPIEALLMPHTGPVQLSFAYDINPAGQIVGYYRELPPPDGSGMYHGFVVSEDSFTDLGPAFMPQAWVYSALGINPEGDVVGNAYFFAEAEYKRVLIHGGSLSVLECPGYDLGNVYDINARGDVVGWYGDGATERGYLWRNGACTPIDYQDENGVATLTNARGINDQGDIVGLYSGTDGKSHGFLRSRFGEFTTIDGPTGNGNADGINSRGDIVGEYKGSDGNRYGFLLSGGVFTSFSYPGAPRTRAFDISDDGETIVGFYHEGLTTGPTHGFVLTRKPLE